MEKLNLHLKILGYLNIMKNEHIVSANGNIRLTRVEQPTVMILMDLVN